MKNKLISLKHYNVLCLALDRIIIHNAIFPETCLVVMGFARDRYGQFVVVVKQPYVSGDPITEEERVSFMYGLGFVDAGMDYGMHLNYKTPDLYIGDINEFNAIKGDYGLHVIDADCRLNVPEIDCGGTYIIKQPVVDFSNPYDEWRAYL